MYCLISGAKARISGTPMIQPFRFSELLIGKSKPLSFFNCTFAHTFEDGESRDEDKNMSIETAGSISLSFFRATNFRQRENTDKVLALPTHAIVPKKILKGASLSHLTRFACFGIVQLHLLCLFNDSLDSPQPRQTDLGLFEADYVDGGQSPFAKVQFKYRPLGMSRRLNLGTSTLTIS